MVIKLLKWTGRIFIITTIILFLFIGLFMFLSLLIDNEIISFILSILVFVLLFYLAFKIWDWYPDKIKELTSNKYNELKIKENKTMYEELYVNAYTDYTVTILELLLKENKVNNVYNLDFHVSYDKNYVSFHFNHKRHSVYYYLYENKIEYYIDSPPKYDHLDCNKEYEKTKKIDININEYDTLESYFNELIPSIRENIEIIDKFEEDVNLISINKVALEEAIDYKDYNKDMSIFLIVLSFILLIMCVFITINTIELENKISIILNVIILLIPISGLGAGIYALIVSFIMAKDIKKQNVSFISGTPDKAKLKIEYIGYRQKVKICTGIKIFINDKKLILPYSFSNPTKEDKMFISDIVTKTKLELTYYTNSKLIVSGSESIKKNIKSKRK